MSEVPLEGFRGYRSVREVEGVCKRVSEEAAAHLGEGVGLMVRV